MKTSSDFGTQFGAKTTKPTLEICTWRLLGTSSKYRKFKKPRILACKGGCHLSNQRVQPLPFLHQTQPWKEEEERGRRDG
ncbi:hypothetical protein Pyn_18903 [Prunus yedoensis var. nudiflora]|uniref:Uncharacterized protein n=1 Tax=Prunus yedoensis var. nudiflora TaxID=2094558 RepID=A0A314YRX5_PRUYE|nr:hypothetical protein Pyn_18903 [Prunus yedoensis var. nudiflora]